RPVRQRLPDVLDERLGADRRAVERIETVAAGRDRAGSDDHRDPRALVQAERARADPRVIVAVGAPLARSSARGLECLLHLILILHIVDEAGAERGLRQTRTGIEQRPDVGIALPA